MNDQNTQLQDEESSVPYDAEVLEYLDHINFENADFDDNENDYISLSFWVRLSTQMSISLIG